MLSGKQIEPVVGFLTRVLATGRFHPAKSPTQRSRTAVSGEEEILLSHPALQTCLPPRLSGPPASWCRAVAGGRCCHPSSCDRTSRLCGTAQSTENGTAIRSPGSLLSLTNLPQTRRASGSWQRGRNAVPCPASAETYSKKVAFKFKISFQVFNFPSALTGFIC